MNARLCGLHIKIPFLRGKKPERKQARKMSTSKHIVIIVMNAQGHIIPTIALTRKLARQRKDFTITLVTTPLNAKFIRSKIFSDDYMSSDERRQITVAEMAFKSSDHGLPPDVENTDAVHIAQLLVLVNALQATCPGHAKAIIESIIEKQGRPLCVLADILMGWAGDVSRSFGIPNISLMMPSAFGTLAVKSFWENLPHRCSKDSEEYTLPGFPEKYRFKTSDLLPLFRESDGTDVWSTGFRTLISQFNKTDGILCNSLEEIEGLGLELLRKQYKVPVWAIGPLIPAAMLNDQGVKTFGQHGVKVVSGLSTSKCVEWLDRKPMGSVIYVSFGSQLTISAFQMMELAKGLEESGHPFIWALRPPLGFDKGEKFKPEWLPENFEEKLIKTNRGLLIYGWAPQLQILSHKSTGAFLSHCGWNSVLESFSQGVPIIGWPMADDQEYNLAYLMEEMGVCVKLAGGIMSMIRSKDVSGVINEIMDSKTGKGAEIKKKLDEIARKMRASVIDDGKLKGSSIVALEDFIKFVEDKARNTASSGH